MDRVGITPERDIIQLAKAAESIDRELWDVTHVYASTLMDKCHVMCQPSSI